MTAMSWMTICRLRREIQKENSTIFFGVFFLSPFILYEVRLFDHLEQDSFGIFDFILVLRSHECVSSP